MALSAGIFALVHLTKETPITLDVLLLVYDLILVRRWNGFKAFLSRWVSYAPYVLVILIYFFLRHRALGFGLTQDLEWEKFGRRFLMAPALLWDYFRLQVFPSPLTVSHGELMIFGSQWIAMAWGFLFLGVYSWVLFKTSRNNPGITFGGLWFVITLLPVLNIVPIAWPMASERYSYIPSMGVAIVIGFLGDNLIKKVQQGQPVWIQKSLAGIFIAILIIFSFLTIDQNRVWSSEFLLWKDTVKKAPEFAMGHMNLGMAYQNRGLFEKASEAYQEAMKYQPASSHLLHNLARLYLETGRWNQALAQYHLLIERGGAVPESYYNMGIIYEEKKETDRSIHFYRKAIRENPDYFKAHMRLGRLLEKLEREEEAVRIFPQSVSPYMDLGELSRVLGRFGEAERAYLH